MAVAGASLRYEPDVRRVGEIELAQPLRPQLAQLVERRLALGGEPAGVDAEAVGRELGGLLDAVGQEQQRSGVIATSRVEEPDADLQDALIEPADGPRLGVPLVLDRLMALVVFALVEEPDPFQQPGRRIGRRTESRLSCRMSRSTGSSRRRVASIRVRSSPTTPSSISGPE